jgi:hypothetical protein
VPARRSSKSNSIGEGVQSKIFGIGLSKTGTSSLAQALQRLGYKTKDCMGTSRYVPGDLSSIDMDTVLAHDALTDTPIPSFYKELDARFPGSKFILTVRDRAGWLQSCRKQFNERSAAAQNEAHRLLFEDLYGTNVFDEEGFSRGYERFVAGVHEYFKDRPGDLLVLDVTAGEGWETLCPFLGRPAPDIAFPKANVTQIRWIDIEELASIAEAAGRELLKHYDGPLAAAVKEYGGRPSGPIGLLRRTLHAATGSDAASAAAKGCSRVLVAALGKRSPGVPVVHPGHELPPYAQRRRWNHLWLVDPLDGVEAFLEGRGGFTVDIALVEDGVPIYGVVHAPAEGVTYFGRARKGAFKRTVGGAPVRLPAMPSEVGHANDDGGLGGRGGAGSHALAICSRLESGQEAAAPFAAVGEWCAAAGHAVVGATGRWELVDATGAELTFNGEPLRVGEHRLQRKAEG